MQHQDCNSRRIEIRVEIFFLRTFVCVCAPIMHTRAWYLVVYPKRRCPIPPLGPWYQEQEMWLFTKIQVSLKRRVQGERGSWSLRVDRKQWMDARVSPVHTRPVRGPAWTGFSSRTAFLPGLQLKDGLWPHSLPAQHPLVRPGPWIVRYCWAFHPHHHWLDIYQGTKCWFHWTAAYLLSMPHSTCSVLHWAAGILVLLCIPLP